MICNWSGPKNKRKYLDFYSTKKWASTSQARKLMHTLRDCKCCSVFHPTLVDSFPTPTKLKRSLPKPSFTNLNCKAAIRADIQVKKPKLQELKEIGQKIYSEYNKECQAKLGKSFSDILTLVPDAGLTKKASPAEKKKKVRDAKRGTKRSIEEVWKETDVSSHLSQRVSFAARKKRRIQEGFESKKDATKRVEKENLKDGKAKSHIPKVITGNIEELMKDVAAWLPYENTKTPINWSKKAKEYKIRKVEAEASPPNAGQLLKDYLKSKGVNIAQFEQKEKG
jgi:hypothetical protein